MASPYRELFSAPGSVAFSAAGFVARMPMSMTGIGIITMLSQSRDDYGLAGAVAATFTLSMALFGPRIAREVDRRGQGRVLLPVTGVSVAALGALLLCTRYGAPTWTLFVCAVLAGFMPSMAAMVRARWSELYRGSPRLHTAFSLESVVDELTFMVGPALSVSLCTALFPEAGPLLAVVLLAVGVLLFTAQRGTEPRTHPVDTAADGGAAIRSGVVLVLVLVLLAGGVIVGTVDVVSVAFAEELDRPAAAGLVVASYAAGSAAAGLLFGALAPKAAPSRLLLAGVAGTALTTVPLLMVEGLVALSAAVFVSGLFFAPTMIVVMGIIEKTVPESKLTEGMTWALTGLTIGIALGAAVSGAAVDRLGPEGGFAVAVGGGVAALLVALPAHGLLRKAETERAGGRPRAEGPETEGPDAEGQDAEGQDDQPCASRA
ncbi:MFS transporter [Streptomyces sp. N2-109]|uniref:MFS transporter n=1 Tax=Streptomyces gossypii TaxID=2883101 RepID=A0ABT2JNR6_9ACTN|nr:MFS transporter [Streptomyces gossypii]MCT2589523.1 MFS transporter [Streptomyces gossypii]